MRVVKREERGAHPPNQTFLPPLEMLQLAQRVWPLSKPVRALVCWHGRQPMRAMIFWGLEVSGSVLVDVSLVDRTDFPCDAGASAMSRSSHQSNSVTLWIPEAVNHCLLRSGTKKCTFGCRSLIFIIVGWSMWS